MGLLYNKKKPNLLSDYLLIVKNNYNV